MAFNLHVDKKFWPPSHPDEAVPVDGRLKASGSMEYDFTGGLHGQWARGADFGPEYFGRPMFHPTQRANDGEHPFPCRLFDLVERRTVTAEEVGRVRYATVSHVWGRTGDIDGGKYGVDWKIPIRSESKLEKMLEAARVVIGERYIWLDVLCLNQRHQNETEMARMGAYFENATGCLVWLDDAFEEGGWDRVLEALKEINRIFNLDEYSVPTTSVDDFLGSRNWQINVADALRWIKKISTIEACPWSVTRWFILPGSFEM